MSEAKSQPPVAAVPLGALRPAPWNPRTITKRRLEDLCRSEDVSPATARQRAVRDNHVWGEWEDGAIARLLGDLRASEADLDALGFEPHEIERRLATLAAPQATLADEDDAGPLADAPTPNRGELWCLGPHRLLCGDATDPADVERLMAGERAQVLLTDPPYGVDYVAKARRMHRLGYGHSEAARALEIQPDDTMDAAAATWRGAFSLVLSHATSPTAAWYIWHASGRALVGLYTLLEELDVLHHQTLIWNKPGFVIGQSDYHAAYEPCFYGWRRGHRPPFIGPRNQKTVWTTSRDPGVAVHPTQKPVAVLEPPILNHTHPDEIVYDPFLGSGSTLIAAQKRGRRCYAIEIEPRYVDAAIRRWERYTGQMATREGD